MLWCRQRPVGVGSAEGCRGEARDGVVNSSIAIPRVAVSKTPHLFFKKSQRWHEPVLQLGETNQVARCETRDWPEVVVNRLPFLLEYLKYSSIGARGVEAFSRRTGIEHHLDPSKRARLCWYAIDSQFFNASTLRAHADSWFVVNGLQFSWLAGL